MTKGKTQQQIEITQKLPKSLKLLLCYRKRPTRNTLIVLIISIILCAFNLHDFDFREYNNLRTNTKKATATITNAYYTGISGTIGDDEGTYYINAFEYEYIVNGETHKWTSYSRSSNFKIGTKVYIKYNIDSPQYSVIIGYDYRPKGNSDLILLIIPIISIFILLYHIYKGIIFNDIIKTGIITSGKITKTKVVVSGDSTNYTKLTFSYNSDTKNNQEKSITTSNTKPYLKRGGKQYIIYKKSNPKKALVLNNLSTQVATYIKKNWIK